MHPYGGTPKCHRCGKAVYAAEQIMGPGRMLYHKPCLKCTSCNKRLDSLSLMEHDQEPYCKQCHVKQFGTVDLRHRNLPHRDEVDPTSPSRSFTLERGRAGASPPTSPTRANGMWRTSLSRVERNDAVNVETDRGLGLGDEGLTRAQSPVAVAESMEAHALSDAPRSVSPARTRSRSRSRGPGGSNTDTNANGVSSIPEYEHVNGLGSPGEDGVADEIPRSRPFSPTYMARSYTSPKFSSSDTGSSSILGGALRPTVTGSRYGMALGGSKPLSPFSTGSTSSTSSWSSRAMPGTGTPLCARCMKPVYFAEQAKAVGKTFHKFCLRCTECNTSLDSTRLAEKEGKVVCRSCYGKLYGPQGSGYALLGKAGG